MNRIELLTSDENLETVLTIINNLRNGLIFEIKVNEKPIKVKQTRYQPKTNTVIYENESATNDKNGKYMSSKAYKQRMSK